MNKPSAFVTLDRYKHDLALFESKYKFLKESFERILSQDSCDSSNCTLAFRDKLCKFYDWLCTPADEFFTDEEWSHPLRSSVQSVQIHFEFEGER